MYRSAALFLIILFSVSAFSVDSRVERWNMRIDRLKKIRSETSSGKTDKDVVNELTANEIKSGEEFLSLLNRYREEDGSLKSENKKYSLTEIEKKVKDISLPAITVYYLSDIYRAVDDTRLKEQITGEITQHAVKKYGAGIKISSAELNALSRLYLLEKGMAEFEEAIKIATSDILSKTEYELSRTDYNSNETDIKRIIRKCSEESLASKIFSDNSSFNEKYLSPVPQWKYITEQYSNIEDRNRAAINFISSINNPGFDKTKAHDINSAEKEVFDNAREKITDMLQNTTATNGAMGNNPYYDIPDLKKLCAAIDEIDRYRKSLIQNINGNEDEESISKIKNNNTGIATRSLNHIELQFKNEETRIDRLKKTRGDIIIYNEEVFKTSKTHFNAVREELYRYANLSSEFTGAIYSAVKSSPQKYIDFHRYRTERYILYISFSEKLTSNILTLSETGSGKFHSTCKGTLPGVLTFAKSLLKPENIPTSVRETLSKENLKEFSSINAGLRTKGTLLINQTRKNYDECIAGFSRAVATKKESSINSETQIAQDETDRLFSFAKKCAEKLANMNYTMTALQKYRDEYGRISNELKKGNKIQFSGNDASAPFFSSIPDFKAETIEKETATRELLAREGLDALSGSITLMQYYKRKCIPVKYTPTGEEISLIKKEFSNSPEIIVSSWKMNGKNFRQIDLNVAAELKKLNNKNAWNNAGSSAATEILTIDKTGINVAFTPPAGWKKIPDKKGDNINRISFESPDMKGLIEVTSVREEVNNLQYLAGLWPKKSGFSMIEKNWGKKNNCDYIKSTSKNTYDGIMESYMIPKNGYVIILSGKTTGDMYRQLNRTLSDIFRNLEIKESSI